MKAIDTEIFNKLLFDRNEAACTAERLASLWSEFLEFKTVVEKTFAPKWSSGLFQLKLHFPGRVKEDLDALRGLSFTNTAEFEHFGVLMK